jgi:hypothetical protein
VNLILGGLITLAGTCIVQILVIPWVQGRNRRRERWENNVTEMVTLLEEELPRALEHLRSETYKLRLVRVHEAEFAVSHPDKTKEFAEQFVAPILLSLREDSEKVSELRTRLRLLMERSMLVNRSAPLWRGVMRDVLTFDIQLWRADPLLESVLGLSDDAFTELWKEVNDRHEAAVATVKTISGPMRPPRTYPHRRLRRWLTKQPSRVRLLMRSVLAGGPRGEPVKSTEQQENEAPTP